MKRPLFILQIAVAALAASSAPHAQEKAASTTIYRQVMPDGRIVYSDNAVKGGKIDNTITVDPPIKGNLWTTVPGTRTATATPQSVPTPIRRVNADRLAGAGKTLDDATMALFRAEGMLEDAKRRQQAGSEPLPGERTGNASGGTRLNAAYQLRQRVLARDVTQAEAAVRRATAERDALK